MSDRLKELRERSQKRKQLLAQAFGLSSPESLKDALMSKNERDESKKKSQREEKKNSVTEREADNRSEAVTPTEPGVCEPQLSKELDEEQDEEEEEEEVYTDSSTFLKGTQSENPHNDYCQHFLDTGERPQNFIRDVGLANRFEEYPKLRELIKLKDELIERTNTPPMYLHCDLEIFDLNDLGSKFDVILIEPPLEEHQRSQGAVYDKYWSWEEISRLDIGGVSAQRSFVWMWCGNSEGLEWGRECLRLWGFRRCEDICWIKTNIKNPGHNKYLEPNALFQTTKEHCIMGIKGTVKRSTDGDYIHSNVDIDLLIAEDPEYGCKDKPTEIFHLIEHFCLGRRRLHMFGRDSTLRPGWLTIGTEITSSNFYPEVYSNLFNKPPGLTTGYTDEIERLRPKSPPARMMGGDDFGGRGRSDGHSSGPGRGYGGPMMRGGNRGFRPRGRSDNMHRPHLGPR